MGYGEPGRLAGCNGLYSLWKLTEAHLGQRDFFFFSLRALLSASGTYSWEIPQQTPLQVCSTFHSNLQTFFFFAGKSHYCHKNWCFCFPTQGEYQSVDEWKLAIRVRSTFESSLMRRMSLEPIIQGDVKSEREQYCILTHIYETHLERWHWWSNLQGSNGDADIKDRFLDTVGEGEGGMICESSTEMYAWLYVK